MIKIIEKKVADLIPYENNARINDGAVDAVANSIKEFGIKNPIIIDRDNVIVCGHTRIKACEKLGIETVPCVVADDLTDEQIKAFRIADNSTAQIAEWDLEKLQAELENIDMDMVQFGLQEQIAEIEKEFQKEVQEDEVPEVDEENEPITQLGDIWQLGEHRLMCGDSTDAGTVAILMDGKKADLFLTDPPYNVAYEGKTKDALTIENDKMGGEEFREFLVSAFTAAVSVLKDGGGFYVWFASREHCNFETALNESGLEVRQELIWKKNTMVLGRQDYQWKHEPCLYGWKDGASHNWYSDRCQTTILEFNKPARNGEHPTMKPVELFAYQIQNSTKKMDIVLDLFGGSGTTIIACEQTGRIGYSMELDPKYCDVIIKRYENLTGNKAVKIN